MQGTGYFCGKLNQVQYLHLQFPFYPSDFSDKNLSPILASNSCPLGKYRAATSTMLHLQHPWTRCIWLCLSCGLLDLGKQYFSWGVFFSNDPFTIAASGNVQKSFRRDDAGLCYVLGEFALCSHTSNPRHYWCLHRVGSQGSGEGVRRIRWIFFIQSQLKMSMWAKVWVLA